LLTRNYSFSVKDDENIMDLINKHIDANNGRSDIVIKGLRLFLQDQKADKFFVDDKALPSVITSYIDWCNFLDTVSKDEKKKLYKKLKELTDLLERILIA